MEQIVQPDSILILDDRTEIIENTSAFLSSMGIIVIPCLHINEAIVKLNENYTKIILVIVDLKLENESGLSFILKFNSTFSNIPFILFSAWTLEKHERNIIKRHKITFFDKARLTPNVLVNLIENKSVSQSEDALPSDVLVDYLSENNDMWEKENRKGVGENEASLKNQLYQTNFNAATTNRNLELYRENWEKLISDLVEILAIENGSSDGKILIGNDIFTHEQIISEIKSLTPIGQMLVELHTSYTNDLYKFQKQNNSNKWQIFSTILEKVKVAIIF
jgi:response regulator RpfG family c-di-GMP phosphodiesterase